MKSSDIVVTFNIHPFCSVVDLNISVVDKAFKSKLIVENDASGVDDIHCGTSDKESSLELTVVIDENGADGPIADSKKFVSPFIATCDERQDPVKLFGSDG